MKKHPPLIVVDVETLGLGAAPIWEVAWIKIRPTGGVDSEYATFVQHDRGDWFDSLPEPFQQDYLKRYDAATAKMPNAVSFVLNEITRDRPLVLGSNPGFDMSRLEKMASDNGMPAPGWHYHPEDVPTLARGWLNGKGIYPSPPWKSDLISQMIGVDPRDYGRHTALGDVRWTLAMWKKVMGQ